jgi:hypothetical protein
MVSVTGDDKPRKVAGRPSDATFAAIERKIGTEVVRTGRSSRLKRSIRARWRPIRVIAAVATAVTVGAGPPVATAAFRHGQAHAISQALLEAEGGGLLTAGGTWSSRVLRKKESM